MYGETFLEDLRSLKGFYKLEPWVGKYYERLNQGYQIFPREWPTTTKANSDI